MKAIAQELQLRGLDQLRKLLEVDSTISGRVHVLEEALYLPLKVTLSSMDPCLFGVERDLLLPALQQMTIETFSIDASAYRPTPHLSWPCAWSAEQRPLWGTKVTLMSASKPEKWVNGVKNTCTECLSQLESDSQVSQGKQPFPTAPFGCFVLGHLWLWQVWNSRPSARVRLQEDGGMKSTWTT